MKRVDGAPFAATYLGVEQAFEAAPAGVVHLARDGRETQVPVGEISWIRPRQQSNVVPAVLMGVVVDAALLYALTHTSYRIGLQW